jgi:predicted dinucleotide-binding enzyme
MKIAILGTGIVGQTLAGRLVDLGHDVCIGTRDVSKTMARDEPGLFGTPPFHVWQAQHPPVRLAAFADAAAAGELVINATSGAASLDALHAAGADNLAGKTLLDVSNPLDFSGGMPPVLFVSNTDSLAEQIQRAFPAARVVKSLNTMNANLMVNPGQLGNGEHSVFVSGNDAAAKDAVSGLLRQFGWRDIVDLGDISSARGAEMLMPIWLRLFGETRNPFMNFKLVR